MSMARARVAGGCTRTSTWTAASRRGKSDEKNVLRSRLEADHCYVMDRWYAQFKLFDDIHAVGSSYVCRVRDNSRYDALADRPLSKEAIAAGVLSDQIVALGAGSPDAKRPQHQVRLIQVRTTPSKPRGKRPGGKTGPPSDGVLRIATNLLDVPAEIIAEIYRQRWTIELFFRFFKHVLGCRHLLSTSRTGIEIQAYCAIIACLLLALWTGGKPTLRTHEMVCLYLQGWADEEELLAHLNKLKPHVA
jgi:IS4 transposase